MYQFLQTPFSAIFSPPGQCRRAGIPLRSDAFYMWVVMSMLRRGPRAFCAFVAAVKALDISNRPLPRAKAQASIFTLGLSHKIPRCSREKMKESSSLFSVIHCTASPTCAAFEKIPLFEMLIKPNLKCLGAPKKSIPRTLANVYRRDKQSGMRIHVLSSAQFK